MTEEAHNKTESDPYSNDTFVSATSPRMKRGEEPRMLSLGGPRDGARAAFVEAEAVDRQLGAVPTLTDLEQYDDEFTRLRAAALKAKAKRAAKDGWRRACDGTVAMKDRFARGARLGEERLALPAPWMIAGGAPLTPGNRPRIGARHSFLAAVLFGCVGLQTFSPTLVEAATRPIFSAIADPAVHAQVDTARRCGNLSKTRGVGGLVLGFEDVEKCAAGDRSVLSTDVEDEATVRFLKTVEIIEGETDGLWTHHGLNAKGLARAVAALGRRAMGDDSAPGGTPPIGTAFEASMKRTGHLTVGEKLGLMIQSASYAARYLPSTEERADFITRFVPCATSGWRAGIRSGELSAPLCAYAFFDKPFEGLDQGEMCILAGAAYHPLLLNAKGAPADRTYEAAARIVQAKRRAIEKCLAPMFKAGALTAGDFRAYSDAVEAADLSRPRAGAARSWSPERWAHEALPGAMSYLHAAARKAGSLADLSVTIDAGVQSDINAGVKRALADLEAVRFNYPACENAGCSKRLDATVAVAEVVDGTAVIRGIWETRPDAFAGARAENGERASQNGLASAHKAFLAPLILAYGGANKFCLAAWNGVRDRAFEGYSDCAHPEARISLSEAFAVSSNLAFLNALEVVPGEALRQYARAVGFRFDPNLDDERLRRALVLGSVATITPEQALMNFAALMQPEARVAGLRIFADAKARVRGAQLTNERVKPAHVAAAAAALRAPVEFDAGTLRVLKDKIPGCDLFGKTGSPEGRNDEAKARLVLLGATCGTRSFVAFARIEAEGGGARPIGAVSHRKAALLACGAIVAARAAARGAS